MEKACSLHTKLLYWMQKNRKESRYGESRKRGARRRSFQRRRTQLFTVRRRSSCRKFQKLRQIRKQSRFFRRFERPDRFDGWTRYDTAYAWTTKRICWKWFGWMCKRLFWRLSVAFYYFLYCGFDFCGGSVRFSKYITEWNIARQCSVNYCQRKDRFKKCIYQ